MKSKVLIILRSLIYFMLIFLSGYLIYNQQRLNNIISKQNALIKKTTGNDSKFLNKAKKYTDSIQTYTEAISFILNGKKLNSDQFIKVYEKLRSKNDSLQNLVNSQTYIYNFVKNEYGFKIKYKETATKMHVEVLPYTRADSARVALQFFKDRLKRTKDGWEVNITGPKQIKEANAEIKRVVDSYKGVIDSTGKK
jgi:hypothetical protein